MDQEGENRERSEMPDVQIVDANVGQITDDLSPLSSKDEQMPSRCIHHNEGRDQCVFEATSGNYCSMHALEHKPPAESIASEVAGSEANVSSIDASSGEHEHPKAESQDCQCVFFSGTVQCKYRSLDGGILCPLHWDETQNKFKSIFDVDRCTVDDSLSKDSQPEDEALATGINTSLRIPANEDEDEGMRQGGADDGSVETDNESELTISTGENSTGVYKHKEFKSLWQRAEEINGQKTDEIEQTTRIRGANAKMDKSDTTYQEKAQYGRLLPNAMRKLELDILDLKQDDVFLDIGHGIGNTCLHASFCVGCESRGIEVVHSRHAVAEVFTSQLTSFNKERDEPRKVGKIELRHGKLEDPQHIEFLTKGVTKAYVNNFNGVFAERTMLKDGQYFLDNYVAGLFALLQPGAVMITFHPLSLGMTRTQANESRKRKGLRETDNASFYEKEILRLGPAYKTVKWKDSSSNRADIFVYKYTRVVQSHGHEAVFVCANPDCEKAVNAIPIPAAFPNEQGRHIMNQCTCGFTERTLRRRSIDGSL